jgi:hypothetical protein
VKRLVSRQITERRDPLASNTTQFTAGAMAHTQGLSVEHLLTRVDEMDTALDTPTTGQAPNPLSGAAEPQGSNPLPIRLAWPPAGTASNPNQAVSSWSTPVEPNQNQKQNQNVETVFEQKANPNKTYITRNPATDTTPEAARAFETGRMHSIEFELNEGDTLVNIDFGHDPKNSLGRTDCFGVAWRSQRLRMHSHNLLAIGSSKFADMFKPTHQFRVQRRLKLVGKLPEGVKYVLDLTPPTEGDELVFQMTELSLTPGIIDWWSAYMVQLVDPSLVDGHDDICPCSIDPDHCDYIGEEQDSATALASIPKGRQGSQTSSYMLTKGQVQKEQEDLGSLIALVLSAKESGKKKLIHQAPAFRAIPDYCPVRHRNGIIRLLMIIEGKDVVLNSASRVWTLVAVAKIFDCTSLVRDRVLQWIMTKSNAAFIEVLPEEALQIGFTLELSQITRTAFRILVYEMAIEEAGADRNARRQRQTTVFGRKLGDPGDELKNLIQHAARDLLDRTRMTIEELRDPFMFDSKPIEHWANLMQIQRALGPFTGPAAQQARQDLKRLMDALTYMVTYGFETVISTPPRDIDGAFRSMDFDRARYVQPQDFELLQTIMPTLNVEQQLLCPFIYHELERAWSNMYSAWNISSKHPDSEGISLGILNRNASRSLVGALDENDSLANRLPPYWYRGNLVIDLNRFGTTVSELLLPLGYMQARWDIEPPPNQTRHILLTLNEEMKYLPLWAGGNNDGTGGVFEKALPPAEMGPNGPGPAYHTGLTLPSAASSMFDFVDDMRTLKVMGSTTAASNDARDSISTVYRPDQVIADDVSLASESFTVGSSDYRAARFQVPADHQTEGQVLNTMVGTTDEPQGGSRSGPNFTISGTSLCVRMRHNNDNDKNDEDNDDLDDNSDDSWENASIGVDDMDMDFQ